MVFAEFPNSLSGNLPRHRVRRRAVGPARHRARAPRRLHREPPADPAEGQQRAGVPDRADCHVLRHRVVAAGVRGAEGGRRVRDQQARTADRDADPHRQQRFLPRLRHLPAHPGRDRHLAARALAAQEGPRRQLPPSRCCGCRSSAAWCGVSTRRVSRAPSASSRRARYRCWRRCVSPREVVTNMPMREAVNEASERIREGSPIGKSLGASRLFPPMTIHLIASGETSGELETMLERAATNQERETRRPDRHPAGPDGAGPDRLHGPDRDGHRVCAAAAHLPVERACRLNVTSLRRA